MSWDLRILSWNLWELRGDVEAVVDAVADLAPDVLLVQEAPRFVLPRARLGWLARRLDRQVLVGGGLAGRGLALLGTDAVARQVVRRGAHPVAQQISDLNSTYPRGVAAVRVSVPGGGDAVLAVTHLALQQDNRRVQAAPGLPVGADLPGAAPAASDRRDPHHRGRGRPRGARRARDRAGERGAAGRRLRPPAHAARRQPLRSARRSRAVKGTRSS